MVVALIGRFPRSTIATSAGPCVMTSGAPPGKESPGCCDGGLSQCTCATTSVSKVPAISHENSDLHRTTQDIFPSIEAGAFLITLRNRSLGSFAEMCSSGTVTSSTELCFGPMSKIVCTHEDKEDHRGALCIVHALREKSAVFHRR